MRMEDHADAERVYETLRGVLEEIKSQLSQLIRRMTKFEERLEVVEEEIDAAVDMEEDSECDLDDGEGK